MIARKLLIVVSILLGITPCRAQFDPTNLGSYTVVGNPTTIPAPESAISISQLSSLLTTQSSFVFSNLVKWGPISGTALAAKAKGELYYDQTGAFIERNSPLTIFQSLNTAGSGNIPPNIYSLCQNIGNNAAPISGCSVGYFQAQDPAGTTNSTKGVLYGLQSTITPVVARNNSPNDDATGLIVQNGAATAVIATDAMYVGHNSVFTGGAAEWQTALLDNANVNSAFAVNSTATIADGLDLCWGVTTTCATVSDAWARIPNNVPLKYRNAAGNGYDVVFNVDGSDNLVLYNGGIKINSSGQITTAAYFNYNSSGAFPSVASGLGIITNFSNGPSEVDFFNTNTGATDSFRFYQQTGAAAATLVADLTTTNLNINSGAQYKIGGVQIASTNLGDVAKDTSWVPTFAAGGGTFTSIAASNATYNNIGKNFFISLTIHITTLGSATTNMQFTLPSTANKDAVFTGYDANNGRETICKVSASSNNVTCTQYDSTFAYTTADFVTISGWYESQ